MSRTEFGPGSTTPGLLKACWVSLRKLPYHKFILMKRKKKLKNWTQKVFCRISWFLNTVKTLFTIANDVPKKII